MNKFDKLCAELESSTTFNAFCKRYALRSLATTYDYDELVDALYASGICSERSIQRIQREVEQLMGWEPRYAYHREL